MGKLVLYEGMRRLRARGMDTAIVGTASVNARAARLYQSVGFEMVGLDRFWVREV
jgi:ribosomal protein S18 acetylase RimI-like enzyme